MNKGNTPTITGQRIRELIRQKGMTEKAFAESINIPAPSLSAWITGRKAPNPTSLKILAANLNTTVDYLQGNTDMQLPFDELMEMEKQFQERYPEIFLQQSKNELILKLIDLLGYDNAPIYQSFNMESWETAPGIRSLIPDIEEYVDCKCSKYLNQKEKRKEGNEMMTMNYSELMQQIDTLNESTFEFCQRMGMKWKRFDDLIHNRKGWTQAEMLKALDVLGLPADSLQALFFTLA